MSRKRLPTARRHAAKKKALLAARRICSSCADDIKANDVVGKGGCAADGCSFGTSDLCGNCLEDHGCDGGAS